MNSFRITLLAAACGLAAVLCPAAGKGSLPFEHGGHRMKVWYFLPAEATADVPVQFVIHGVGRNAEEYLNDWIEHADRKKFLLVVPEFSRVEFPGEAGFNSGNLFAADGTLRPRAEWSFSMIEPIFDAVRAHFGLKRENYQIYGHSAGAQFVQRFLYFVPEARFTRLVAANAGWYMLPTWSQNHPYGLQGGPADQQTLPQAFARAVIVLLGEADTDSQHQSLRRTPEADAQGLSRLARGHYFFAEARKAAAALQVPFNWTLSTAPGIAHVNKDMAPFAVKLLYPD